jgi:hypothetical protein
MHRSDYCLSLYLFFISIISSQNPIQCNLVNSFSFLTCTTFDRWETPIGWWNGYGWTVLHCKTLNKIPVRDFIQSWGWWSWSISVWGGLDVSFMINLIIVLIRQVLRYILACSWAVRPHLKDHHFQVALSAIQKESTAGLQHYLLNSGCS